VWIVKTKKLFALLLMLAMLAALLPLTASAEGEPADGYYLLGDMNTWTPSAGYRFSVNPANASEYMLDTTLTLGQQFKLARIESGAVAQWYPAEGNNWVVVDSTPPGDVRIYLRPGESSFWIRGKHAITVQTGLTGGSVSASPSSAPDGETITLSNTPEDEYELDRYVVINNSDNSEIPVTNGTFSMPNAAVTVSGVFKVKTYDVTISTSVANGTLSADKSAAAKDETVTLTAAPDAGYELDGIPTVTPERTVSAVDGEPLKFTFTMPSSAVTASAVFKPIDYPVTAVSGGHGQVAPNPSSAHIGDEITITVTPDTGYILDTLSVSPNSVTLTPAGENTYTIIMPAAAVTVSASFKRNVPDGYYLLGKVASLGMNGWTVNNIDQSSGAFSLNAACTAPETEYALTGLTLTAGDEFKIVRVSGNSITEWYPITGQDNYVVDGSHAGERVIYFRPTGRTQDDHWYDLENQTHDYFYVAPRDQNNEDGSFYLITAPWDAAHISQSDLFIANPGLAGEYILVTDLGYDFIKVAQTGLDGAITAWYPDAFGAEYPVTDAQKGVMVVYFQKTPVAAWGNRYVYITPAGSIKTLVTAGEGTISAVPTNGKQYTKSGETLYYTFLGDTVTWTAAPEPGWELDTVKLINLETGAETVLSGTGVDSFLMPQGNTDNVVTNVRVEASFKAVSYTVTVETDGNGTASADRDSGVKGTEVTLTATANSGYTFKKWEVLAGGVSVSGNKFSIGTADVRIKAIFESASTPTPSPSPSPTPSPSPSPRPGGGGIVYPTRPSPTPKPTATPSPTPSVTPAPSPTPAATAEPASSPAPAPTPAPASAGDQDGNGGDPGGSRSTEDLTDGRTPLVAPSGKPHWAIADLVLGALSVLLGGGLTTSYAAGGKKRVRSRLRPAALIPAAAAIVTLLMTQDFSGLKVLFDKWTLLMAAYPLAGGLMGAIAGVREDKKAK
jgi:outer membrane biosynthesis protein TonB